MTTQSITTKTDERTRHRHIHGDMESRPTQGMSERAKVANREWYPGLCTTCARASDCTFPRVIDQQVLECEEFEGLHDERPLQVVHEDRMEAARRFAVANREWFPGLCMTCEKRETCTFPKPEGGVFNCDEFE